MAGGEGGSELDGGVWKLREVDVARARSLYERGWVTRGSGR